MNELQSSVVVAGGRRGQQQQHRQSLGSGQTSGGNSDDGPKPERRRKYLSALKTRVRRGDARAVLTLRLPRVGGLDKLNSSMEASVRSVKLVPEKPQ
jgi:hypothetical protein